MSDVMIITASVQKVFCALALNFTFSAKQLVQLYILATPMAGCYIIVQFYSPYLLCVCVCVCTQLSVCVYIV